MPVRTFRPSQSENHEQLTRLLAAEWREPDAAVTEPVIIEDFDSNANLVHVYVVWSAWPDIDSAERGQIIMEAADARYGPENTRDVTIAMGVTPTEADAMRLTWRNH